MEIKYNPDLMLVNNIQLTRNEALIFTTILSQDIVSKEEINQATKTFASCMAPAVNVSRLNKKLEGILRIENKWGKGYYIQDKSNIEYQGNTLLLKAIQFGDYREQLKEYFNKAFEEYKEEVVFAETRFKERMNMIL